MSSLGRRVRLFGLLASAIPCAAQQAPLPSAATLSADVKVVNVFATVHDKHGQPVRDLTKDDFTLQVDGRPEELRYFAQESDLPLKLGLLVDTSLSQRNTLDDERTASYAFLDQMLRPEKDNAFLIHFDREVELLEDFTSSRPQLQKALQSLQTPSPQFSRSSSGGGNPDDNGGQQQGRGQRSGGYRSGGGTLLYDAIFLASDELMSKQHGRKALIVLSDGVDRGSKETLSTAIETAQKADTIVYSIYFKGEEGQQGSGHRGFGGRMGGGIGGGGMGGGMGRRGGGYPRPQQQEQRPDGKKVLEQISKETGGRLFEASKKETVAKIYSQIEDDLRNQYSLGFSPDKQAAEAGYHKIALQAKKKDLSVQARDGYYGAE